MVALQKIKNQAAFAFNPRRLKLTLLPTEQCNFRCRYCYEDFKIGKMSPRVVNAVRALLENRASDIDVLELAWFGGEPLVAMEIIQNIQGAAFDLCKQHDIALAGSMTTNGYLLSVDLLRSLNAIGIRHYQISLDGKEDEHNQTRVLASGAGTFDRIWRNLVAAASTDVKFHILLRIHITTQNLDTVEDFVDECWESFASDRRFSFFFKPILNLGGSSRVKSIIPDKEKSGEIYDRLSAKYNNQPTEDDVAVCYAAQPNAFIVRADGRIARCTVAFNAKNNHVGDIQDNGELLLDIEKLNLWFKGFATLDEAALACPLTALRLY